MSGRIFDLLGERQRRFGDTVCLAGRAAGGDAWRTCTTSVCRRTVDDYSRALLAHGLEAGDRIAIAGANRPEWIFIDLAAQQIGVASVPLFPTLGERDFSFILKQSKARLVFVTDAELLARAEALRPTLPHLEAVYSLTATAGRASWPAQLGSVGAGDIARLDARRGAVSPADVATIIFTSGTTGVPKGVMLTHRNIMSNVRAIMQAVPLPPGGRALSGLPLSHSFERLVSLGYLASGVAVYLLDELADLAWAMPIVRPDYFAAVPRIIERMYEALARRGQTLHGLPRRLFDRALALGLAYDERRPPRGVDGLVLALARRTVFRRWRQALGGRLRLILSGGARLEPKLCNLVAAAGMTLLEGYGLAETSTFVTANRIPAGQRRAGTVGLPVPGVEVRVARDGEVLVRGPNVMLGYLERPDLTARAVDGDGWFHTGDLGALDGDGFLTITGRKKDLFKLSVGKYVAPEALETHYRKSRYIEQLMIVGEGRKYVAALIVPAFAELEAWRRAQGDGAAGGGRAGLVADPAVHTLMDAELARLGRDLGHVERVKRYVLLPDEWTVKGGELSPTLKIRRHVIAERYADAIGRCYD